MAPVANQQSSVPQSYQGVYRIGCDTKCAGLRYLEAHPWTDRVQVCRRSDVSEQRWEVHSCPDFNAYTLRSYTVFGWRYLEAFPVCAEMRPRPGPQGLDQLFHIEPFKGGAPGTVRIAVNTVNWSWKSLEAFPRDNLARPCTYLRCNMDQMWLLEPWDGGEPPREGHRKYVPPSPYYYPAAWDNISPDNTQKDDDFKMHC